MKHLLASRARVLALSLLAALPAQPAAASYYRQFALGSGPARQYLPAAPDASRAALAAAKRKAPLTLVTSPAPAQPGEQLSTRQPTAAALPQVVTLRGIVVRATGQPCAGASVYAAQSPRQLTVTDSQGAFTLVVTAETAVLLRVEYFGEGSSRVEVSLPAANLLRITLGQ